MKTRAVLYVNARRKGMVDGGRSAGAAASSEGVISSGGVLVSGRRPCERQPSERGGREVGVPVTYCRAGGISKALERSRPLGVPSLPSILLRCLLRIVLRPGSLGGAYLGLEQCEVVPSRAPPTAGSRASEAFAFLPSSPLSATADLVTSFQSISQGVPDLWHVDSSAGGSDGHQAPRALILSASAPACLDQTAASATPVAVPSSAPLRRCSCCARCCPHCLPSSITCPRLMCHAAMIFLPLLCMTRKSVKASCQEMGAIKPTFDFSIGAL